MKHLRSLARPTTPEEARPVRITGSKRRRFQRQVSFNGVLLHFTLEIINNTCKCFPKVEVALEMTTRPSARPLPGMDQDQV